MRCSRLATLAFVRCAGALPVRPCDRRAAIAPPPSLPAVVPLPRRFPARVAHSPHRFHAAAARPLHLPSASFASHARNALRVYVRWAHRCRPPPAHPSHTPAHTAVLTPFVTLRHPFCYPVLDRPRRRHCVAPSQVRSSFVLHCRRAYALAALSLCSRSSRSIPSTALMSSRSCASSCAAASRASQLITSHRSSIIASVS
eukprot:2215071-Prymnesium_polylepis.1